MQKRRSGAFLKWRFLALAVGALLSLSVAGEAAPLAASPVQAEASPSASVVHAKPATTIRRYAPFEGGRIAAGIKVVRTVSGSCSAPSSEDPRNDAYQCLSGHNLGDPCFADKAAALNYVLCPLLPPATVVRMNLTQPLPRNSAPARATGDPWAVQTAEGAWCYRYVGQRLPVLQFTVSYACIRPKTLWGFLLDEPRRGTIWTALFAPGLKTVNRPPGSYRRVDLASAWW